MGRDKATLPFGGELMLQRVVRLVGEVVERVVVVAAPDQQLPALPAGIEVVRDEREDRGPLEGLAAGLRALETACDAVYATSCDVPLLRPAFVRRMFDLLGQSDCAVPKDDQYHHPLAAVYRTSVLPHVDAMLAKDRLRPVFLFEEVDTRVVAVDDLRDVDPQLTTLNNLNRPEDYTAALAACGFDAPSTARPLGPGEQPRQVDP